MIRKKINDDIFFRTSIFVLVGGLSGLIGGFIAGFIGSYPLWIVFRSIYPGMFNRFPFVDYGLHSGILCGIPIGLFIGIITGLHHGVFEQYSPKSLVWAAVTGMGAVSGYCVSGLSYPGNSQLAFIIETAFIGLTTGWLAHKLMSLLFKGDNIEFKRTSIFILSLVIGLLFIFLPIYGYFRIWDWISNLPNITVS